jgi:hypothetical protein
MAYIPKLETGEKLIRQFRVKLSKKAKPFLFATDRNLLFARLPVLSAGAGEGELVFRVSPSIGR